MSAGSPNSESFCQPMKYIGSKAGKCHWVNGSEGELGSGAFGSVFEACCGHKCNSVAKIINYDPSSPSYIHKDAKGKFRRMQYEEYMDLVEHEVDMQRIAADAGLSLPIYEAWFCDDQRSATVIMGRADQSFRDVIIEHQDDIDYVISQLKRCLQLVQRLNQLNIQHNDAHPGNIMYVKKTDHYLLIDFSFAEFKPYKTIGSQDFEYLIGSVSARFPGQEARFRDLLPVERFIAIPSPPNAVPKIKPLRFTT
jgi:tRNA A-37 threonylcarbamoyl transferase component Bud32